MLILKFRFLAGRYHATPWGAHVNEGLVEWPPSPWRVLRAMIAVGFSRLGWIETPTVARALLERLATRPPTVYLPPARAAHTRHYMPTNDKPTKVLDTFAHVGDGEVAVVWDVDVPPDERALVEEIASAMPYLGRAESWVECRVADEVGEGLSRCDPADVCPGPGLERVALLAPETSVAYGYWRTRAVEQELASAFARAVEKAEQARKKAPKSLAAKDVAKIQSVFPPDIIEALRMDVGVLRDQGWSQPPGSRWVSYWRRIGALTAPVSSAAVAAPRAPPTTALFALASDTKNGEALPRLRDALWRMEALHDTLVRLSDTGGNGPAPVFTGKDAGEPMRGHRHASLLPLTLDRRRDRIDHVLVHAPMGFDERARTALGALQRTWAKDLPALYVTLVGMGAAGDFAKLVPNVDCATTWRTQTPLVLPRHQKPRGRNSLEGQVREEMVSRGFPEPVRVEVLSQDEFRWFRRARRDVSRAPPVAVGFAIRVEFDGPVNGPIAIGYASHFGLGSMVPCTP